MAEDSSHAKASDRPVTWRQQFKSDDEKYVSRHKDLFSKYINERVGPRGLEIKDIIEDLKDGVVLWHFYEVLGRTELGPLVKGKLTKPKADKSLMKVQMMENMALVWKYINETVKTVGIGPQDVVDGNEKLVLGLIWSTIVFFVAKSLNADNNLAKVKEKLLAWAKDHTRKYEDFKDTDGVMDLGMGWFDGKAFLAVLNSHDPIKCPYDPEGNDEADRKKAFDRAQEVFGVGQLIDPNDDDAYMDEYAMIAYIGDLHRLLKASTYCHKLVLKQHVDVGLPGPEHFEIQPADVPKLSGDGSIVVKLMCLSADPYLRIGIKAGGAHGAQTPGNPMRVFVSGKVVESNNPDWAAGDLFGGNLEAITMQVLPAEVAKTLWKLDLPENQVSYGIGILGMPGSTAYAGIDLLQPKEGETIFVSAAAGAVGGLVGMLAKMKGAKVIGSAGGPEKGAFIKEKYGFDHAIDYKSVSNADELEAKLLEVAPEGIDMYFENVGGMHFEAAMRQLRVKGRVAVCGLISGYNEESMGIHNVDLARMLFKQQTLQGFMCGDWLGGRRGTFHKEMPEWIKSGKIPHIQETFFEGIENWPMAFQALFTGKNLGKVVVNVG